MMFFIRSFIINFSVLIDFEFINFLENRFNFIILFDFYSLIFLISVLLISRSVFTFRTSYISLDKYYRRFHFLLLSFVASIVLLIISPNLIRILLGWDGLGISSYLLVIYYRRRKSYNAGIITVMSNRVGDALIIICFRRLIYLNSLNIIITSYTAHSNLYWIFFLLVIAGCTKSAQIPFRAWLPAAIAAPTPVSALVHSSTLVTAGVYLIFRYENLLILININLLLIGLGSLTIFMARVSAFFEIDIKKIVALSTLRQLGVIMSALGAGFYLLGFFHLLSHAFFKALLFIRAGNLIHSSERFQDLRVIGGRIEIIPLRTRIVIGCSRRLCGIPFISAFYSKEAIIEILLIHNISFYFYIVIILGVLLTIFYRTRFLVIAISRTAIRNALTLKLDKDFFVNFSMLVLIIPAVRGGSLIGQKIANSCNMFLVPTSIKIITLTLLILGVYTFYNLSQKKTIISKLHLWIFGSLWGLPILSPQVPIKSLKTTGDYLNKFSDFSWVYYSATELILNQFKFQSISGLGFTRIKFIRLFNLIFLSTIAILILKV